MLVDLIKGCHSAGTALPVMEWEAEMRSMMMMMMMMCARHETNMALMLPCIMCCIWETCVLDHEIFDAGLLQLQDRRLYIPLIIEGCSNRFTTTIKQWTKVE